jgi:Poxvirus D5 protein-like
MGLPEGASLSAQGRIPEIEIGSHVAAFVRERLETSSGSSLAAAELRAAYEAWCATHNHKPLSMPKFAAELKALGYDKWKSCGLIRYRCLRFAA